MKVREVSPSSTAKLEQPKVPNIEALYDKGLLAGIEIDPADQQKERRNRFTSSTSLGNIPEVNTTSNEEGWVRQDVPSLGVPYGVPHLWVRSLTVPILARVHAAQAYGERPENQQKAFTMLVDALAPTIRDFDIRDLTVPDWHSHLYWLRLNSYPRSPLTVPWTSKYGNENVTRVTQSSFEFEELKLTREEYLEWNRKGVAFPTVRDMELLYDQSLSEETRWTLTYAQYVHLEGEPTPDWMKLKVAKLEEMGADGIALINQFSQVSTHGVIEQVKVRDDKFDLDAAIEYIQNEVNALTMMLDQAVNTEGNENTEADSIRALTNLTTYTHGRASELAMLKKVKENDGLTEDGVLFQPEVEVVALATANATLLFP